MDWTHEQERGTRLAWGDLLDARLAEAAPEISHSRRAPLAAALALYCARECPAAPLTETEIDLLVLHSLRHAGERDAAEAALARWSAARRRRVEALATLGHAEGIGPEAGRLAALGLLYPNAGAPASWTLMLDRWLGSDEVVMELDLIARLRRLFDAVAPLWDATAGHGRLGVRGLTSLARRLEGPGARPRAVRLRAEDVRRWLDGFGARTAMRRGWAESPRIVHLDLVG